MGLTIADHTDLLRTTLQELPDGEFEVAYDSQRFEFANIYTTNPKRIDGGTSIKRNIMLDERGNARYRQMFDLDTPTVKPLHKEIDVPWALVGTDYSWDVFELKTQMSSTKAYIDLVRSRRVEAKWGLSELLEDRGWLTPQNQADRTNPYGIPYYLNFRDSGSTGAGFDGQTIRFGDGSTSNICAGIDASAEKKWRNYAATYTAIDAAFLTTLRTAFVFTKFTAPALLKDRPASTDRGPMAKFYCGLSEYVELQALMDSRDDNNIPNEVFGHILAHIDGVFSINGYPVVGIPQLEGVEFDPFYFVDWSKLQPVVHAGYWMEESDPAPSSNQHTVISVYVDAAHNNLCLNRRAAGFVVHKQVA
ncbi:MAG: hypothetical protein AAGG38_02165 [Planctomycetota bacterium]